MNNENILKDANSLRQTPTQKKQIKFAVKEVLTNLDEIITQAHDIGKGSVQAYLPMQFNIDGMSFSRMQQHVWCRVIMALEEKNYKVNIEPLPTECIIYIQWESEDDKIESERQLKMLAEHTLK
jgi:hypothetical protein